MIRGRVREFGKRYLGYSCVDVYGGGVKLAFVNVVLDHGFFLAIGLSVPRVLDTEFGAVLA